MKLHVLDASAWIRLFVPDGPLPAGLEQAALDVQRGAAAFVAPELILVEAAHALARKLQRGALAAAERDALWRALRRTSIDLLPIAPHVDAALALSGTFRISAYDALYLAVALHVGAPLLTADKELARAAAQAGV
jgi:predicted nucleic acid-binding protein